MYLIGSRLPNTHGISSSLSVNGQVKPMFLSATSIILQLQSVNKMAAA